nr:hypothetical protein [Anaerolineae bacterium]
MCLASAIVSGLLFATGCGSIGETAVSPELTLGTGEGTASPAPDPLPSPTGPPARELVIADIIWPLPADLYYIEDDGRIWYQPRAGDETASIPISPHNEQVLDFSLAPGGDWVIYRTDGEVMISTRNGLQQRTVFRDSLFGSIPVPPAGNPRSVAWAPDGSRLAYATPGGFHVLLPSADSSDGVLLYPISEAGVSGISWSPGSTWILVYRDDNTSALYNTDPLGKWVELGILSGHTWLSDGRLAFAPAEGGLALLTPGDIDSRVFILPQDRYVTVPCERSDRMLAFFVHTERAAPGVLYTANPFDLSFGVASNLALDTANLIWDPAGTYLLGVEGEPGSLIIIDPAAGTKTHLGADHHSTVPGWGSRPPEYIGGLSMSSGLFFLAPQAGVMQIWRLPTNGDAPEPITSASSPVASFSVSWNGTQIAFSSGESLWRMVLNSTDLSEVVSLSGEDNQGRATPAFSPSGRQIAYADNGIKIIDLDSGEVSSILPDGLAGGGTPVTYNHPRWSADGEWLLVRASYTQGADQVFIPVVDRPGRENAPIPLNLFDTDGRWISGISALAFGRGSAAEEAMLALVQPGNPSTETRLLSAPVLDARQRQDGKIAFLQAPPAGIGGPTTFRLASILPNATYYAFETPVFVLEEPVLSPDTRYIAGLINTSQNNERSLTGQLVIIDLATETIYAIEGITGAYNLVWEP